MTQRAGTLAGVVIAVSVLVTSNGAFGAPDCPSAAEIDRFAKDWWATRPAQAIAAAATNEDALCAQEMLVDRLNSTLGPPVGYKVALTGEMEQKRFGAVSPLRGVLLKRMLLEDGVSVPARFGARPLFEADLLVRIDDAAVNYAKTPAEVIAYVSEIIPFIELSDLAVGRTEPMNRSVLTAVNAGARLGVYGRAVVVENAPGVADALASMVVRVTDQDGNELAAGKGSTVLGNPLNSIIWLVENGVVLKAGDLVSVGSITPPMPPEAGQTITANYEGLPGNLSVSVRFE